MGWDKGGRYYTRSRRVYGRVVREYIGGGRAGEGVAQRDALELQKRETEREWKSSSGRRSRRWTCRWRSWTSWRIW